MKKHSQPQVKAKATSAKEDFHQGPMPTENVAMSQVGDECTVWHNITHRKSMHYVISLKLMNTMKENEPDSSCETSSHTMFQPQLGLNHAA